MSTSTSADAFTEDEMVRMMGAEAGQDRPAVARPASGDVVHRDPDRLEQCWRMRVMGMSQMAIAAKLGTSQAAVSRMLAKVRKSIPIATREELVWRAQDRYDLLIAQFMPQVMEGNIEAARLVLAIMEREAKLLGLDAPANASAASVVRYEISGGACGHPGCPGQHEPSAIGGTEAPPTNEHASNICHNGEGPDE